MKKLKIGILILTMMLVGIILSGCTEIACNNTEQDRAENQAIQECEHNWVITSEYSWIFGQYRTVSKCSKCGEVVK